MGNATILVSRPGPFEQTFVTLVTGDYIWNMVTNGEEKSFENVDHRRRRTIETIYPISSPEDFGSGELKKDSEDTLIKQQNIFIITTKPHRIHADLIHSWVYSVINLIDAVLKKKKKRIVVKLLRLL